MLVRTLTLGPLRRAVHHCLGVWLSAPHPFEVERVERAQPPIPGDQLHSARAGRGAAGQLGCAASPPRLALGARRLRGSGLALVRCVQPLVPQLLLAASCLFLPVFLGQGFFWWLQKILRRIRLLAPQS